MSSETRGGRSELRRARRFRATLTAVTGVLIVLVGALTFAGALQGPRLQSGSINADAAVERAGQRLVLRTDQAVTPVDAAQVTVTPATAVEVATDGAALTIRFGEMLRGATTYQVTVAGVAGSATGVTADLHYSFTTPDLSVFSLLRRPDDGAEKSPDEIQRRGVHGGTAEVVFSAPRIQEYAVLPGALAVVTLDDESHGTLVYVPTGESLTQPISLPAPGTIRHLDSSGVSGLLAFTFTADEPVGDAGADLDTLYVADPADGTGLARPVLGLDGAPLALMNLVWVPGTSSLVAQSIDTSLYLVDATGESPPTPLGQHAELRGFIPGTTQLVVADLLGGSILDLTTGVTTPLDLPDDGLSVNQYSEQLLMLGDQAYAEILASASPDLMTFTYSVVAATASEHRIVYEPADDATIVHRICASPNGQYLAIEVTGPESEPDLYPNSPAYLGTTTYFVDLATGKGGQGLLGISVDWCG